MTQAAIIASDMPPASPAADRSGRRKRRNALLLVLPLLIFTLVSFVAPIVIMLARGVSEPEITRLLPLSRGPLATWDGTALPSDDTLAAVIADLAAAQRQRQAATIAKRLAAIRSDLRQPLLAAARAAATPPGLTPEGLLALDTVWRDPASWRALAELAQPFTDRYLLQTLDLTRNASGEIVSVPDNQAIFLAALGRTFGIGLAVTLITLVLGYPLAYFICQQSPGLQRFMLLFVLLPFWTSVLVRTAAWLVVLQTNGLVNDTLMALHVIGEPLKLVYTRSGTILGMVHIQLPFTLLPIYSVMQTISPVYVRAARSLGATPTAAFWRVYVPQTLPGVAAGCLLTFILCLGYYITPAILGGPADQMLSYYVAYYLNNEINWSMAAAVSTVLLVLTILFYIAYSWFTDPTAKATR